MNDSEEDLDALFELIVGQQEEAESAAATLIEHAATSHEYFIQPQIDKPIFERLGAVVRVLHDSMRELGYDRSLADVSSQITDAHGRLAHIANLTEEAANKVLNATDEGMPAQDALAKKAKDIEQRWTSLFAGNLGIDDFKQLSRDSQTFATDTIAATEDEKARLLSIMMSQDFQDLTGQLIKKVVAITSAVERELAQILLDNAPGVDREKAIDLMAGPSAPANALQQGDVDNLLDSLGF